MIKMSRATIVTLKWLLGFAVVLGGLRISMAILSDPESPLEDCAAIAAAPHAVMFEYGIPDSWVTGDSFHKTVRVPGDLAIEQFYASLVNRLRTAGGEFAAAERQSNSQRRVINVDCGGIPLMQITLVPDSRLLRQTGKIALVVKGLGGDFGSGVKALFELEEKMSFSVAPGLRDSDALVKAAVEHGFGLIIHLPVDCDDDVSAKEYRLCPDLLPSEAANRVHEAVAKIPQATAVGSDVRVEQSPVLLSLILETVKRKNLSLVDFSHSPEATICPVAEKRGISCLFGITLDVVNKPSRIRERLFEVAQLAAQRGRAVCFVGGSGETLEILQEELPRLRRRGFKFVSISELAQQEGT